MPKYLINGFAAGGAFRRQGLDRAAEVAAEPVFALVVRHGNIAVVAKDDVAAVSAGDEGGVSAAVDKQHGLLAFFVALA